MRVMQTPNKKTPIFPIAVGYWKNEDRLNFPDPSEFVNPTIPLDLRNTIATYLENGERFIAYLGHSWCRFKCGVADYEMGASCFTDGLYCWPEGLSHYIRVHNVWLPKEFIDHVVQNKNRDWNAVDRSTLYLPDYTWWEQQQLDH